LQQKGFRVFATNYSTKYGEIDLVSQQGDELVFVEVKTRKSNRFGHPEQSVTKRKVQHIMRAGHEYMRIHHWTDRPWRIDVIAITTSENNEPEIVHFTHIDNPANI